MTPRQKRGISIGVGGLAGLVAGAVIYFTMATPDWLPLALQIVGLVGGVLGFSIVLPNTED